MRLIINNALVGDIVHKGRLDPSPLTGMSSASACDATCCKLKCTQKTYYICSDNWWWQTVLAGATIGVPLRRERVFELGRQCATKRAPGACLSSMCWSTTRGRRLVAPRLIESRLRLCQRRLNSKQSIVLARHGGTFKRMRLVLRCKLCFEEAEPGQSTRDWMANNLRQGIAATKHGAN